MSEPSNQSSNFGSNSTDPSQSIAKNLIQRAGGRHMVFRIKKGPLWFVPKPYALISNIEGSILFFYGIGQIWVTHRKLRKINDWFVRVPRLAASRIKTVVDNMDTHISHFTQQVEELGLIGTLIIERKVIEFHWTIPRDQRGDADDVAARKIKIDSAFNQLATEFAKLQLEGVEGKRDSEDVDISIPAAS